MSRKRKITVPESPDCVTHAKRLVQRAIAKHGTRYYRKHRSHAEAKVEHILSEAGIKDTSVERYWYLAFLLALIGKEQVITVVGRPKKG